MVKPAFWGLWLLSFFMAFPVFHFQLWHFVGPRVKSQDERSTPLMQTKGGVGSRRVVCPGVDDEVGILRLKCGEIAPKKKHMFF